MATNAPAVPARFAITAGVSAVTLLALLLTALLLAGAVAAQNDRSISGLTATSTVPGQIAGDWDDTEDAKDYRVAWTMQGENFKKWHDDTGNAYPDASAQTITELTEGETYKIKVRARFDDNNSGTWSEVVTALVASTPRPPEAPTGLTNGFVFHDSVPLSWDDPDDDSITGYRILRRTTGEFATIEANTASQATSYTDSSVEAETSYAYRIRAINDDGESEPSNTLNVTTPEEPEIEVVDPDPPAAPTGLSASALQPTTVVLDWDDTDDENVDGYQILRRNRDGKEHGDGKGPAEFSLIVEDTESTDTSHTDSSAEEETRYEYRVKARWGNLLSDASNTAQVETPPLRTARSTHNTDLSLSSITVDSSPVPGFAHDRTSYEYGVASTVTQVTIAATTTNADAEWEVTSPADANTGTTAHEVNLSAGRNAVIIRGTSEDTNNTRDYTLNVNRGVDTDYGWKAVDDFDTLKAAGANNPTAIWSDGTTMWVADRSDDKIYTFDVSSKARDAAKEFDLDSNNGTPNGIWSDGTTLWVVDLNDNKLYAYTLSDGTRDTTKEFNLASGHISSAGIWSDGTTMWVVESNGNKLYAYTLNNGMQDTTQEFNLASENDQAHGIWSDGTTIWVVDRSDDKIYSFNMPVSSDATLKSLTVSPRDILRFDPDRKTYNVGVASDVTEATITVETNHASATWVSNPADPDTNTEEIEVRSLSVGANTVTITVTAEDAATVETYTVSINRSVDTTFGWNAVKDLEDIAPSITSFAPTDIIGNDGHFLVSAQNQVTLDAYLPDGTRDSALNFDLDTDNGRPLYIYTDSQHLWVSDETDAKLYVYDLDGNRQSTMDFDFDSNNDAPLGLWSDGRHMWVADETDAKLYAYNLSGTRQTAQEFDLHTDNANPAGIWSDGVTMWVADGGRNSVFAYSLDDHSRIASREFSTLTASGNSAPVGIWSDGLTMWAIDRIDEKVYAYIMPVSDNTQLRTITIDGEEIPNFDPATRTYTIEVERETTQVTVAAQVRQLKAEITAITPADVDSADGHQVDLTAKTTTVRIDVTAQDGSTTAYGLQIRNPALSAPPVLTLADLNPSIDENTPPPTVPKLSNRIARIETSDPDGDDREMTFSLDTASQQFFTILPASIKNAAVLHNKVSLDHEAMPAHDVIFTATDEDDVSASITVTITVNDVNEPGTVQFIPPTAITGIPVIAFVNDPEEPVSGETWQWYQGDAQGGPWTIINGETSDSYTPPDADEGKFYRVTARAIAL